MIRIDDPRISATLLALPVLHVLCACFYLWSYSAGFGSDVAVHFSASDIFSTSINDMVFVYFFAGLWPLALLLWRYSWEAPSYEEKIDRILDTEERETARRSLYKSRRYIIIAITLVAILVISKSIYDFTMKYPIRYMAILASIQPILIATFHMKGKGIFKSASSMETAIFVTVFFLNAFFIGASSGQADRLRTYKSSQSNLSLCKNMPIIKKVSDLYIGVLENDRKVLLDSDCIIKFYFPATK